MEAKKFIILECVFSCCCFPDLCDWGVKEREREGEKRRVYVGDLWILLCAATAIYLHSGSGGSKAVRGFVLSSFFL